MSRKSNLHDGIRLYRHHTISIIYIIIACNVTKRERGMIYKGFKKEINAGTFLHDSKRGYLIFSWNIRILLNVFH
jgi:hypothetical protein